MSRPGAASSPEESPRFPDLRDSAQRDGEEAGDDEADRGEGILSATRPDTPDPAAPIATAPAASTAAPGGSDAVTTQPQQPALPDATEEAAERSGNGGTDATQPVPANGPADATTETVPAAAGADQTADGGSRPLDQDATQRLEPVGKPYSAKAPTTEGKPDN